MPDPSVAELRTQLASERQGLADELDVLRGQARSLVPPVVIGVLAAVVLSKGRLLKPGIALLRTLR